jgi:hypothetical protein
MVTGKNYILDVFSESIDIRVDDDLCKRLDRIIFQFEIRGDHPYTLNSQIFGDKKFIFIRADRDIFFNTIGVDEEDVTDVIKKIPSINKAFKVVSDSFNLVCVYLAHLLVSSKSIHKDIANKTAINVLNYMQYRLMASAVNHYFPHGVNHEIMQTVVESLNLKFAIKQYETWKNVISSRSESIIADTKAHHSTLVEFNNDQDILYLISDTSTRIRSQLKIIVSEYYTMKDASNIINSHSSIVTLDGEKILREKHGSFEMLSSTVFHKILSRTSFIDEGYIRMVQSTIPRLSIGIIKRMLYTLIDEAKTQMEDGTTNRIINKRDGTKVIFGIESLVQSVIKVIYTSALHDERVKLGNKIMIYMNTKNIFIAARVNDTELLEVRASINDLVTRTRISNRESTVSGLVIALVLYLNLISFQSL